jgi:LmbE family N-acetylglucosaminyl deacetylase
MKILVVAPHPDDELLGCGGLLLRRRTEGCTVGWLIVTTVTEAVGWSQERIQTRQQEIVAVSAGLGILPQHRFELGLPTTRLDMLPLVDIIERIAKVFHAFQPEEVLLPHAGDMHSDHRVTFEAASACTKWFRYPSIKRVLTYETLSETDCIIHPQRGFQPNVFVDISNYLQRKLELLAIYESEMGELPFPRSIAAVRAQATLRGAQAGYEAAEGFCLLRERG